MAGLVDITAVPAKTLGTKIVRHAFGGDALQARVQLRWHRLEAAQSDDKAVGTVGTAMQLARMASTVQAKQTGVPPGCQVRVRPPRQLEAEPMAGDSAAILA